ncbi:MAG: acyl-CoA thioesterase domain-containing protein, partial [Actinomycetota bacterium]
MAASPTGSDALDHLIATVSVTGIGDDRFQGVGSTADGVDATFGGHFLAQSISAALATVEPERHLHSVHASFLRGGRPGEPFTLEVERVRDGASFANRRVRAFQDEGRTLFELTASCAVAEDGPEYQGTAPPAGFEQLPDPESLPTYRQLMESLDPLPLPEEWAMRDYGL